MECSRWEGQLREVMVQAVCARGEKNHILEFQLKPLHPASKVLGCWAADHNFSGSIIGDTVIINGDLELTVWYAYEQNQKTELLRERLNYLCEIELENLTGRLEQGEELHLTEEKEPQVSSYYLEGEEIKGAVEIGFTAEIMGLTKLRVLAYPAEED
ncbi:outer spore coat protein CotE [Carboxydocella sp. JDF658]|uniref:outer spore coat protein CotE n=1 Tax=Carboxydocella sp. JDF658 TaxID=1926600 RepID=UPI0009D328C4|nr:outer spore coat protein CotE [Carboxydocella sp. JDF658]GAW30676.1 spore coat protein E [Carboxydocella sp. JDF658]